MVGNPSIELISADGLAVFASIPRVSKIREATPKQLLPEPYDNVLFYSHSFTCVCRDVIPVDFRFVISFSRLAAESHRVSSRERLGQNVRQHRKLIDRRRPAVSFCPRGQNEYVSRLRTVRNGC